MEISQFTIRIMVLFLPGIISYLVIHSFTVTKETKALHFIIYAFVLGFLSYFSWALLLQIISLIPSTQVDTDVRFLEALRDPDKQIDFFEIFWVSVISLLNGLLISFIVNQKYVHRLAQTLHITKKFPELDVWDYVFNSSDETAWVTIRDVKNNLAYEGWVETFSDTVKDNELFVRDVVIFRNSTGERLYETPGLYISRNRDEMTIEFPALEFTDLLQRRERNQVTGDTGNGHDQRGQNNKGRQKS